MSKEDIGYSFGQIFADDGHGLIYNLLRLLYAIGSVEVLFLSAYRNYIWYHCEHIRPVSLSD